MPKNRFIFPRKQLATSEQTTALNGLTVMVSNFIFARLLFNSFTGYTTFETVNEPPVRVMGIAANVLPGEAVHE